MDVQSTAENALRKIKFPVENRQLGQDCDSGVNSAEQEEWTEAVGQHSGAAIVPQARDSVHDPMLVALGMLEGALEADRPRIISALDGLSEAVAVMSSLSSVPRRA